MTPALDTPVPRRPNPSSRPARSRRAPSFAIAIALAVAAGFVAAPARAEPGHTPTNYFQAGVGTGLANTQTSISSEQTLDWMLGYRINAYVGLQAVGWHVDSVQHSTYVAGAAPAYDFTNFTGAQVVGYFPATSYWDIYGELGAGRARQVTSWPGVASQDKGDGIAGIGVRWQVVDHFALSLDVSQLWNTQVTHSQLRAEFNF